MQNPNSGIFTYGKYKITKTITFSNTAAAAIDLFTVTGDVNVKILPVITTDLTSAADANLRLGTDSDDDAMIVDTLATDMDARNFWNDQSPTNEIESDERIRGYDISDGNDVILTLDAQVDTGSITFYCYWTPHSDDGYVEVA